MTRLTLNAVNKALAAEGAQEKLVRGDGYFFFLEGNAHRWQESGVYVFRLNELTLTQWIAEWKSRKDEYEASL